MADRQFERTIINLRERPLSSDVNEQASQVDRTLRDVIDRLFLSRTSDSDARSKSSPLGGFIGDSLLVQPNNPVGMSVLISKGMGFVDNSAGVASNIDGVSHLDDLARFAPVLLTAVETVNLDAAVVGQERVDIIEVKVDRRRENLLSRDIFDETAEDFVATNVNKTLSFVLDGRQGKVAAPASSTTGIGYKTGIAQASGTFAGAGTGEPATTAGYVKIATILVSDAVASVDGDKIIDQRKMLGQGGQIRASCKLTWANSGGLGTVGVSDVVAPPGAFFATRVDNTFKWVITATNFYWTELYLFLGQPVSPKVVAQLVQRIRADGSADVKGEFYGAAIYAVDLLTVDATLQTALAVAPGTTTWPGSLKVAIGQKCIRFKLSPRRTSLAGVEADNSYIASQPLDFAADVYNT